MTAIMFLALAIVIAVVGCTGLYLRERPPTSVESGIDSFKREMHALATREAAPRHGRRRVGKFGRWKR